MKRFLVLFAMIFVSFNLNAQIGYGSSFGIDLYQRYSNPEDGIASPSAGNALLNILWGPRIWIGGTKVSASIEGQINIGLTSFSLKDFKGLGAVSFPVIFKLNTKGLSGFYPGFAKGVSFGAGFQWSKTELYHLSNSFKEKGGERNFNRTIIGQIDLGYGSFGTSGALYFRYGKNIDTDANSLNIGIFLSINKSYVKKNIEYIKIRK